MDRQKVVILHSGNLNDVSPGGISEYVKQFIRYSNSDVYLLGTENKESGYKIWKEYSKSIGNKQYFFIPINFSSRRPISLFYFISLFTFILFNPKFWRSIKVVYAQRMEYVLPFCLLFIRKQVVMAIHGSGRYASMFWGSGIAKLYWLLEYIAIWRATKIFILNNNSEFGVPYYKKKYNKFKNKIFYTLVPVNMDLFKPLDKDYVRKKYGFAKNEKVLLFLGRIEHNPKRVLILPDVLNSVKRMYPETRLLVVGSGSDKCLLEQELEKRHLLNDAIFIDYVKHGEGLVELINCADVSLVCSSFEGICMSALESISSGIPVIATNVGDIKEYLFDGQNGYLIDLHKDEEIIPEMSKLVINLFKRRIKVNREPINKFNAVDVIKKTESLLLG